MARELGGGRLVFAADGDGTVAPSPPRIPTEPSRPRRYRRSTPMRTSPSRTAWEIQPSRSSSTPTAASAASRTPAPPSEVGCPASGRYHIRITAAGGSADRFLPCRTAPRNGRATGIYGLATGNHRTVPGRSMRRPLHAAPAPERIITRTHLPGGNGPRRQHVRTGAAANAQPLHRLQSLHRRHRNHNGTPTRCRLQRRPRPPNLRRSVATCDLVETGTCYRRIVGPTMEIFDKVVSPGYTCDEDGTIVHGSTRVGRVSDFCA